MHNVALMDRLRSDYPDKPLWTVVDDFAGFFTDLPRRKAVALALSRGAQGIGTNVVPHTTDLKRRKNKNYTTPQADTVESYRNLYAWVKSMGGAYSQMRATAPVGILYSHQQAVSRSAENDIGRGGRVEGSHEGKTNEALFMLHAAGIPARIITPAELKRGLPEEMQALFLTGLNRIDDTWAWYEGLEDELNAFVENGGKIILDHESVSPAPAIETDIILLNYANQNYQDQTPALLERNKENRRIVRQLLPDIEIPIASSDSMHVWALPSTAGNTGYLTVVNQTPPDGEQNMSKVLPPVTAYLSVHTDLPVYDTQTGTPASLYDSVDLTTDSFRLFAIPAAEPVAPEVTVTLGDDYWYQAEAVLMNGIELTGIPVEFTLTANGESVTLYGASSTPVRLPIKADDPDTDIMLTATELLSGNTSERVTTVHTRQSIKQDPNRINFGDIMNRETPLVIALTPEQHEDEEIRNAAQDLADAISHRDATVQLIAPGELIESRQPYQAVQKYPQWQTVDADLILFGSARDNILMFDQARGGLLPSDAPESEFETKQTFSPFYPEQHCLNVMVQDDSELIAAIKEMTHSLKESDPEQRQRSKE
jgi:hypothetical protein